MRVLVTGGTSYLGQAIVRALQSAKHRPVVFARRASASGLPGDLVDGDGRDAAALDRAAANCDAICHLAALVAQWHRPRVQFEDVNVGGVRHALSASAHHRIPLIYTSSFLALPPRSRNTIGSE